MRSSFFWQVSMVALAHSQRPAKVGEGGASHPVVRPDLPRHDMFVCQSDGTLTRKGRGWHCGGFCMGDDAEGSWGAEAIAAAGIPPAGATQAKDAWLRRHTRWIPILGRLWDCRRDHLKEAFYEVACVLLFSTLPLWFFPLVSSIIFTVDLAFFSETVANGELLIYAATLSGTMVYFISKRYGSVESRPETGEGPMLGMTVSFPYGGFFIVLSALICMSAAAIFFIIKVAGHLVETQHGIIDERGSWITSWLLFGISAILFFCSVAYRNLLDDRRSYRTQPTREILASWEEEK